MTCNTSAVAVCCSNASRVSVISRAFSIAMTACAAKFCKQRDLLVGEWPDFLAEDRDRAEQAVVFAKRDQQNGSRAAQIDQTPLGPELPMRYGFVVRDIRDVHEHPLTADEPEEAPFPAWAVSARAANPRKCCRHVPRRPV